MAVVSGVTPQRTEALTGLRFFAAGWVFLYHAWAARGAPAPIQAIVRSGSAGVPLFFVLSGFVLALNYLREGRPFGARDFLVARFARIYPVYLLALLSSLPLFSLYLTQHGNDAATIVRGSSAFVLLQNWLPRPRAEFLPPTWTLSVEAFFYCVCLFIFRRMRLSQFGADLTVAVFLVALAVAATFTAWHANLDIDWEWAPLQFPAFLIGVFLGKAYLARDPKSAASPTLGNVGVLVVALAGLCIVLNSARMPTSLMQALLLGPFAALIFLF